MQIQFPKFSSSDRELDVTYQYRCEVYARHVKETPAGHVITEFLPNVGWSGVYNTISCAASHQRITPPARGPQAARSQPLFCLSEIERSRPSQVPGLYCAAVQGCGHPTLWTDVGAALG